MFARLGIDRVRRSLAALLFLVLCAPAVALAQAPAPETGSSSAPGILAVLGAGALLATGIYFWVRGEDEAPASDPDDPAMPANEPDEPAAQVPNDAA